MARKKKEQDQRAQIQSNQSPQRAQIQSNQSPQRAQIQSNQSPQRAQIQSKETSEVKAETKSEEKLSASKLEALKKKLEEKAKALESKIEIKKERISVIDLNEDIERPKEELLVALEEYVKSGIHLGTKIITSQMRPCVFKRRPDGLAVFNTSIIDKKLRLAVALIAQYSSENIVVCGKREASWSALRAFSKATGIKVFTKKYPAGIITNTNLEDFFEPKLIFVVDPWLDKNPIKDALITNLPIISLCDTNNLLSNADLIIPCNNKSNKSIGLIFWILAREYNKLRKIDTEVPALADFVGE
jgi:small subunit ribosomal protein S2